MKTETAKMMAEMVAYANKGNEIIPMFWQPRRGISATVSAAITAAKKAGLLVEARKDGVGKPVYRAGEMKANHIGTTHRQ